jgi:hypothetical protein
MTTIGDDRIRPALRVPLTVCETGHIVEAYVERSEWAWQILCECGFWRWDDANYCGGCGKPVS